MMNFIKMLIMKLIGMLPDSPFSQYYASVDMTDYQYINWILPLDICANIMLGWLVCVAIYYLYLIIHWFAMVVIGGIAKTVPLILGG